MKIIDDVSVSSSSFVVVITTYMYHCHCHHSMHHRFVQNVEWYSCIIQSLRFNACIIPAQMNNLSRCYQYQENHPIMRDSLLHHTHHFYSTTGGSGSGVPPADPTACSIPSTSTSSASSDTSPSSSGSPSPKSP